LICPNDSVEMHPVRIESHYGQPIILDQCERCGGIWFDESELFRARQGESERIEMLDAGALRASSEMSNPTRLCPRDGAGLFRFTDTHFPEDIILERCPSCRGIWLNRGVFAEYQKGRREKMRQREVWIQPDGSPAAVGHAPALQASAGGEDVAGKIGRFLSTELDPHTMRPLEPGRMSPEEENALNVTMAVINGLLSLVTLR